MSTVGESREVSWIEQNIRRLELYSQLYPYCVLSSQVTLLGMTGAVAGALSGSLPPTQTSQAGRVFLSN